MAVLRREAGDREKISFFSSVEERITSETVVRMKFKAATVCTGRINIGLFRFTLLSKIFRLVPFTRSND